MSEQPEREPDKPVMEQQTRVRDIEILAMNAYRSDYPSGPPWQQLAVETRVMWIDFVDRKAR